MNAFACIWDAPGDYAGCRICIHGKETDGRACMHPDGRGLAVSACRAFGGHCGPEANNMDFPGLRDQPDRTKAFYARLAPPRG